MESLQEMPFFGLKNYEIKNMFIDPKQQWDDVMFDNTLREHLYASYTVMSYFVVLIALMLLPITLTILIMHYPSLLN